MSSVLNHQATKPPRAFAPISDQLDQLGKVIVDCAFQVHKTLGAGLLESIYEEAFCCELEDNNISFAKQKIIPIHYKDRVLENCYRLDLLVEDKIVVELKSVEKILPIHDAQILTYMKLLELRLGYLINFNSPLIKDGIKRKVL